MRRGVNARDTSVRSRVWSGGSMKIIWPAGERLGRHELEHRAVPRAERLGVAVRGLDVGEAAQRPEVVAVVAVERRLVAQPPPRRRTGRCRSRCRTDPSRARPCAQCSDPEIAATLPPCLRIRPTSPPSTTGAALLQGKVAVVTGGGDGIGGAISRLFAEHGAQVEIAEIDPERAERKRGRDRGRRRRRARAHVVDVRVDDDVARLARRGARRAPASRRAREQRRRLPAARAVPAVDAGVVGRDVPDQPAPLLLGDARVPRPDDRRRRRVDRERPLGRGHARLPGRAGLRRDEGARSRTSPRASPPSRVATASVSTASVPTSRSHRRSTTAR